MYRCSRCNKIYKERGDLFQLSNKSALGCPQCAGECHYYGKEVQPQRVQESPVRKPNKKGIEDG